MSRTRYIVVAGVGLIALALLAAVPLAGMTHFTGVGIAQPTEVGTATPALLVDNDGVSNIVEFRDGGTPVWTINDGGALSFTGDESRTGSMVVAAPTAVGTATPALVVDNDGVSDFLDVRNNATPVLTVNDDGVTVSGARDAASGYDYFVTIDGSATGVAGGAKTYGLYVTMDRPAGNESGSGDLDDAGIKVRVETEAITTTTGTVLRAVDAEAKADNPDGTVTNLYGGLFTAKSDTSAGEVDTMVALSANVQNNAAVTTTLMSGDFRLMRQAATEPTSEYVLQVRNSSTSGSGADAAIYVNSDYGSSATTDSFDYGLDFSGSAINTAEFRGENGETINNGTDTAIQIGGFLALTEGSVIDLAAGGTITPTASYQPITTSEAGSCTTSTSTAIADGPVAGAILIICNEDAQDIVIDDGANTDIGGNQTLTGGAGDCLPLIWNGADWNKLATLADN